MVQRQSWLFEVGPELLERFKGSLAETAFAIRAALRERGVPDQIFVKPHLPFSLRLSWHKDNKPVFIDLRSPLLLESLVNLARRYPRLRVA